MKDPPVSARYILAVVVGMVCAGCSFGVHPLMDAFPPNSAGALYVLACNGVIAAAPVLLTIWGVLWLDPFWIRTFRSFGGVLFLSSVWLVGLANHGPTFRDFGQLCAVALLCLPLVVLAIQSPLWFVRLFFHWQIVLKNSPHERCKSHPLSIRDMLVATGLVGLALAGARLAMVIAEQSGLYSHPESWMLLGGVVTFCVVISLVTTLPVVAATLGSKYPGYGVAGFTFYGAIVLGITFMVLALAGPPLRYRDMLGLTIMFATFAATLSIPLLIARGLGYYLRKGREAGAATEYTSPSQEMPVVAAPDSRQAP